MTLSDEMIEEAAEAYHGVAQDPWRSSCEAMKAALTAVLPALRKQVLIEAELEALRTRDTYIYESKSWHGCDKVARVIRSLMDKG